MVTFEKFTAAFEEAVEKQLFSRRGTSVERRAQALGEGLVGLGRVAQIAGIEVSPLDYLEVRHMENLFWFGVVQTRAGLRVTVDGDEANTLLAPAAALLNYLADMPTHRYCPLVVAHPRDERLDAHFRRIIAGDTLDLPRWAQRSAASFITSQMVREEMLDTVQVARAAVCQRHAGATTVLTEALGLTDLLYCAPKGRA